MRTQTSMSSPASCRHQLLALNCWHHLFLLWEEHLNASLVLTFNALSAPEYIFLSITQKILNIAYSCRDIL